MFRLDKSYADTGKRTRVVGNFMEEIFNFFFFFSLTSQSKGHKGGYFSYHWNFGR